MTRGQPFTSQTVAVQTEVGVEKLDLGFDSSLLSVGVYRTDDVPSTFNLRIAAKPNAHAGAIASEIRIDAIGRSGERLPSAALPVGGVIKEDIQVIPPSLLFGAVRVGDTVEETVVLQSLSGRTFDVLSTSASTDTVTVRQLDAGRVFRIALRIAEPGPRNAFVTFVVRIADTAPMANIGLRVFFTGLASTTVPSDLN